MNSKSKKLLFLLITNLAMQSGSLPCSAEDFENQEPGQIAAATSPESEPIPAIHNPIEITNRIEDLTRRILLKEIELERFNLNYKLNAAKQGRWKGWRYALANEANNGLGIAGGIICLEQRGSHLHQSSKVKNYVQERANFIPMIGSIIAGSAAIMEFGINEYHEYEAYKNGFSPGKAMAHVSGLKNEITRLADERAALVKLEQADPTLAARVAVDTLEGKVLLDLRDQSLMQYQRFHLAARHLIAFQQMQYFFDLGKNTTNSIGCAFAYLALHRRRRPWNFSAGVMYDIAGGLTIGGPIASRLFAKLVSEYNKSNLKETLEGAEAREVATLEQDEKALRSASANYSEASSQLVERGTIYGEASKMFQDSVARSSKELDKGKLVATQNIGSGIYVGGSKLASGLLFTIPGYMQLYNQSNERSGRVTNHLLFTSGVLGTQASTYAFLDTLRIQVSAEINRHKLAAKGELPAQLVRKRLEQLDVIEAKLNSANPLKF